MYVCVFVFSCKRRRSTKLGLMSVDVEEHMELDKKMADVEVSPEENPIYSQPQLTCTYVGRGRGCGRGCDRGCGVPLMNV